MKKVFYIVLGVFIVMGFSQFCMAKPRIKMPADAGNALRCAGGVKTPFRTMDDIVGSSTTTRAAREAVGKGLDDLAYVRKLERMLEATLDGVDPATLKRIKALDQPTQEAILVTARGAKNVKETIPDIALRSKLLKEVDGNTLIALGRGDKKLVEEVIDIHTALDALKHPGSRALTLDDVGAFFAKTGEKGKTCWEKYIRPHWQLWLGGAAFTAFMLNPDYFIDALGNFTEKGIEKILELGGTELAAAISGTIKGGGEGIKGVLKAIFNTIYETFFQDIWGIVSFIFLFIVTCICLWVIPVTRKLLQQVGRFFCFLGRLMGGEKKQTPTTPNAS